MLKLNLQNVPAHLLPGLEAVKSDLHLSFAPDGLPVTLAPGDCLNLNVTEAGGTITYKKDVEIFRALAHLDREGIPCAITERASFTMNGLMLDESRNAVHKPETVRWLLRRMALMGLNTLMLYTEDTYEVEGYPYFGYLRGGFSKKDLKALDDYAYALGIEMMPCIQTLGHFAKVLRWSGSMGYLADTGGTLLAGEETTYQFLEKIMKEASEPYRSKRIHIGMDEAGDLGKGAYARKHGSRDQTEIFQEHMGRVRGIAEKLGLRPMIWSDMYFCLLSPSHDYDPDYCLPQNVIDLIPKDVDLVYWDYYHLDYDFYRGVIKQHQATGAPTVFAGGLWSWGSPAVNSDHMMATTLPALQACRDMGVTEVFTTAWGDCGNETSIYGILAGLQVYAEIDYTGAYDEAVFDKRFRALNDADPAAYRALGRFNMIPGVDRRDTLPANSSFWLLYEDPMSLVFEADLKPFPIAEHYRALWSDCEQFLCEAPKGKQRLLWTFYRDLAKLLYEKNWWRETAPDVLRAEDHSRDGELIAFAETMAFSARALHESWYVLWHDANSDYGWDVIEIRLGALIARFDSLVRALKAYASGDTEAVAVIREKKLPYVLERGYWARLTCGKTFRPTHFGEWALCSTGLEL